MSMMEDLMEVFHVSLSQLPSLHLHFQSQQWKHQKTVKICSKLKKKSTRTRQRRRYRVLICNFEQISHILVFTYLTLNKKMLAEWLHVFQTITTLDSFWKYHHKFHFYIKNSEMTTGVSCEFREFQSRLTCCSLLETLI